MDFNETPELGLGWGFLLDGLLRKWSEHSHKSKHRHKKQVTLARYHGQVKPISMTEDSLKRQESGGNIAKLGRDKRGAEGPHDKTAR